MKRVCFMWAVVCTSVLAPVFAADRFALQLLNSSNAHPFEFRFEAVPGLLYDVEVSTNLLEWDLWRTLRAGTAAERVIDTNSGDFDARFYRVGDLSSNIVVEGWIEIPNAAGIIEPCLLCNVLLSSSLDSSVAY